MLTYEFLRGYPRHGALPNTQQDAVIIPADGELPVINSMDLDGNINWRTVYNHGLERGYLEKPKHFPELGWLIDINVRDSQVLLFNIDDDGELGFERPVVLDFVGNLQEKYYNDEIISVIGMSTIGEGDENSWKIERVDIKDARASDPYEIFPFANHNFFRANWTVQAATNGNIWFMADNRDENYFKIAALDHRGRRLTGENGLQLSNDDQRNQPVMTVDPNGGCWVVWKDDKIRAVHFDPRGGVFHGRWNVEGEVIFEDEELDFVTTSLDDASNTLYVTAIKDVVISCSASGMNGCQLEIRRV